MLIAHPARSSAAGARPHNPMEIPAARAPLRFDRSATIDRAPIAAPRATVNPSRLRSPAMPTSDPPSATTYTVRTGDSLGLIAARFGVTMRALVDANADRYAGLRAGRV